MNDSNFTVQSSKSEFNRSDFVFSREAETALNENLPVVALELEQIVRDAGATPATIAVLGGAPHIGLNLEQIRFLANANDIVKLSTRDLPVALARKLNGATTVATTAFFANRAGIKVFATGGVGGVHRGALADVSADLPELARSPIAVVCAGAKSVLDLPATREWLETWGVPVLGWQTAELPAFYTSGSNLKVDARIETAGEAAEIIRARDSLNLPNAVLVAVPIQPNDEIAAATIEEYLDRALHEAAAGNIGGKEITPFLLRRLSEQSNGATLRANLSLLRQNARVAAEIAVQLSIGSEIQNREF